MSRSCLLACPLETLFFQVVLSAGKFFIYEWKCILAEPLTGPAALMGQARWLPPTNHSNCHKTLLSQECCMFCKVMYSVAHGSLGEDSALHFVEVLQNLDFPVPCFVTCPFLSSHQCLVDLRSVYRNMCGLGMLPTMESIPPQPAHWSSFFSCF